MGDWIRDHIRPGMTVVDVGANHGTITRSLRDVVGPTGSVWAIEPDDRCYAELCAIVGADHVLPMAVGATTGRTTLHRSRQCEHNSLFPVNVLDPGPVPAVDVPLASLDALQAAGTLPPRIDAIKVDAQGSEWAILHGAGRLCQTQRPVWYVEFWPQGLEGAGASLGALCDAFAALGYQPEGEGWASVVERVSQMRGHASHDLLLRVA